ncbi:MAG: zinc finger CCCH domain-containing protein, partial [Cyanobacteria bacterium]|nr:zinc finger CCCH domain-containing protein [Cyanobacteriota bacterium]
FAKKGSCRRGAKCKFVHRKGPQKEQAQKRVEEETVKAKESESESESERGSSLFPFPLRIEKAICELWKASNFEKVKEWSLERVQEENHFHPFIQALGFYFLGELELKPLQKTATRFSRRITQKTIDLIDARRSAWQAFHDLFVKGVSKLSYLYAASLDETTTAASPQDFKALHAKTFEFNNSIDLALLKLEHDIEDCERIRTKLLDMLNPQWNDRDEVKEKWGEERWKSNPSPKQDYAARRLENEELFRRTEECLSSLIETRGQISNLKTTFPHTF